MQREKNKSPMPVVIEWLYTYMCAGVFDNGSEAILISLFGKDFRTFRLENSLLT